MNSGSYQIYIEIKRDTKIEIGKLGIISFKKGMYIYTGSAMRNLKQRVERHKRKEKIIRWHIDYLLSHKNASIIKIDTFTSTEKEECERNNLLIENENNYVIKGFGSSDCCKCPGHLVKIA